MRYSELTEARATAFPGNGNAIFRRAYYYFLVTEIADLNDDKGRAWLTGWLADILHRDNPRFKPDLFKDAVQRAIETPGRYRHFRPTFMQRHFFFLAHYVAEIPDERIRRFVTDWLARTAGRTNPNFKADRWKTYTTPEDQREAPDSRAKALRARGGVVPAGDDDDEVAADLRRLARGD